MSSESSGGPGAPMDLRFREVRAEDVPALFAVRIAVRENAYTLDELRVLGITERTVIERLRKDHAGWLCEQGGRVVGFTMANRANGELWVVSVLPEWEGKGIGGRLMRMAEEWLMACGCAEAWLTTSIDPRLRAYGFYRRLGWEDDKLRDGLRFMRKRLRAAAP
jgi:ribosomal protein S18 acetylase RimI-like enzyme